MTQALRRAKAAGGKIVAVFDAGFVVAHGESARTGGTGPGGFTVVVAGDPLSDVRILQDNDKIAQLLIGGQTIVRRAALRD